MLSKKLEKKLNEQIKLEAQSSQIYLSMACWADHNAFDGAANFLYIHSDEERMHMMKLVKYVNNRGTQAEIPALERADGDFKSLKDIFQQILDHEIKVTQSINEIIDLCVNEKDHITNNFMQWYVAEQLEEELLARTVLDKLNLIGNDSTGLYMFDSELGSGISSNE